VSYVIRGGVRFFEQAHIKDVLSYLKIVQTPVDELSWSRALMLWPGIGGGYAEKVFQAFQRTGGELAKVADVGFGVELPPKVREGLTGFKKTLRTLLKEDKDRVDALVEAVIDEGYSKYALMNFDNAQDRLDDLRELVSFAHTYKSLKDFLADVTLRESFKGESIVEAGAKDEPAEELVLSTIHQAKGLEWRAVFVIGLSEGQFPHAKSMSSNEEFEEERRLFYVAATRAKEALTLTHAITRYDYNAGTVISRSSPFILELEDSLYDELEIEESDQEETIYLE
jgi:DNA helicase-2/ATP-dependent DNA helicase PcrA